MFEFFFKYPSQVFSRGKIVLLGGWPGWVLALFMLAAAVLLARFVLSKRGPAGWTPARSAIIWGLETSAVVVLLLLLWQPAISVSMLRPQQNIVAVVVDSSRSMALADEGDARETKALNILNGGMVDTLSKRFQVRLYSMGSQLNRVQKSEEIKPEAGSTRIGDSLKQVVSEAGTLPIGAVILLSDGADSSGGIDLETITEVKRRKIPVHTVGFGREQMERDIEISDAQVPARALAESRLSAQVSFRQRGYEGQRAKLVLRDGARIVASKDVTFGPEGKVQSEAVMFNAGAAGARTLSMGFDVQSGETNNKNNSLTRLIQVMAEKPRILYIEGEPKWEFKFIRRALEDDASVKLVTMLRTTQNKIYRQGIDTPTELEQGFPATVEELFNYQGLIIGGVEAGYFTLAQQELIKQFADRRGGGVLFLGGRASFSDGGYQTTTFAEMLPVDLPNKKNTFVRDPAYPDLTAAGRDSLLVRIEEDPARNAERWKKLPFLANYQETGNVKPGAVVLADMQAAGRRMPLLTIQNYGRGRVGVLATSGTWRWQMLQPVEDMSHEMFWRQLCRWLVAGTPGHVISTTPRQVLSDENRVLLRAEVKDKNYLPASDAQVEARILGPEGIAETVTLEPDPLNAGIYTANYPALKTGSYVAEISAKRGVEDAGKDAVMFLREDGVAENFRTEQNRELLEKLATETGGRYYSSSDWKGLSQDIAYSEAGITARETHDLWNMPIVFLFLIGLRVAEWLLRRRWGVV